MNALRVVLTISVIITGSTSDDWQFPADFQFGTATSAYQIEGGWNADGKGVSVWDRLTSNNPNFTIDHSNGQIACDSYHKWREDVQMLKNLSVDYYRFSLSWTRIFPNGFATTPNEKGVEYYNNLINELKANGIEPVVTLFHWDSPEAFTALGGFYTPTFVNFFAGYATKAFELFGDRVKTWITFNEPKVVCQDYSELLGTNNDMYPNGVIEYVCSDTLIRAHVKVYHIYDSSFRNIQNGKVGITLNFEWSESGSSHWSDNEAAERRRQFEFGLYANPIVYGNYPKVVIDRVAARSKAEGFQQSRLPKFTLAEQMVNRGAFDFIGLNHYNTWLVNATDEHPIGKPSVQKDIATDRYVDPTWEDTEWDGKVYASGLRASLNWLKNNYRNPEILITECGYPDRDGTLEDDRRISFLQKYMNATLQAIILDNVNVKAFTAWSLMDNFEWGQGYTIKFGLYHVDFSSDDRTRTPKKSATYFKNVITTRKV